jgi:hypothetical protein
MPVVHKDVLKDNLKKELEDAEAKAWKALSGYKFMMFGYWAAVWVHLNRVGKFRYKNPFKGLVKAAKLVTED